MLFTQQIIKDLHGGFRRTVHLDNGISFVRRHLQLILQAVDTLNQVMLQLVIGLLQNGLLLRVPRHIPDTLALGGFQLLLCVQQQGFQILRSAFRFTYVLLLVGKVGVETLQHICGVVLYLFEI